MKHLWFGAGLLAVLLAVSLWLGSTLEEAHHTPAKDLDKAAAAALQEDWELASALYLRAQKQWQRRRNMAAALSRHDSVDQIDIGFSVLEDYCRCEETAPFAATCSQVAQQLRRLPESHGFRWWNLL